MKNLLTLLFFCSTLFVVGQSVPDAINYQSVLRNSNGSTVPNQNLQIRFSVLQGSSLGTNVFQEEHAITTSSIGLINLKIGEGVSTLNSLSSINWSFGPYFLEIEVDTTSTGSYVSYGTSELSSVPYSLYSMSSAVTDSLSPIALNRLPRITLSGDSLFVGSLDTIILPFTQFNLTEYQVDSMVANNGYLTSEIDSSITNEIQDLQLSTNSLTITNNTSATTIDLSGYLDNTVLTEAQVDAYAGNNGYLTSEIDSSITNEIQDLQLSTNSLTITNNTSATTIDLSGYLDNTVLTEAQVDAYAGNNGYLTTEIDGSITNEIQDIKQVLAIGLDADSSALNNLGELTVGTNAIQTSAIMEVSSTSKGFLPPRMTQVERNAISTPAAGLIVWCTNCGTNGSLSAYDGTGWANLSLTSSAGTVPTVTTDAITSFGVTSATIGGNILSNGGSAIISRGVCYSSSPNPNITDNIITVTTGTGAYNDFVIGLDSTTTYYVRAYATNANGIAYGNQATFTSKGNVSIGDFFQGGRVFYILQGGDKDYVPGEQHGLIAQQFNYYATLPWYGCTSATSVSTTNYIGDGDLNTTAIVSACSTSTTSAASMAQNSTAYGYTDWFLPSKDELFEMFSANSSASLNLTTINTGAYYWCSTQTNASYAIGTRLTMAGAVSTYGQLSKGGSYYVRIIRKF